MVALGRRTYGMPVDETDARRMLDVRVLDHLVVAGAKISSFARLGLL